MKKEKYDIKNNKRVKNLKYIIIFLGGVVIISLMIFVLILLKNINPETRNIFPPCIVYKLTGLKCAGCGMTRAVHQILNLNFKEAFLLNPLIFIYAFLLLVIAIRAVILKVQKNNINSVLKKEAKIVLYISLFITVIYMILRNITNV